MFRLCDRSVEEDYLVQPLDALVIQFFIFVDNAMDLGLDLYLITPPLPIQYNLKANFYLIENQFDTTLVVENQ